MTIYFQQNGVLIDENAAHFDDQTFPIERVNSLRLINKKDGSYSTGILLQIIAWPIFILNLYPIAYGFFRDLGWGVVIISWVVFFVSGGIGAYGNDTFGRSKNTIYILFINDNNGSNQVFETLDEFEARNIKSAIEKSLINSKNS